ncbi:hypothetical protein [Desulfoluna sp.]|uniref:hypothetical protein n=1 Tax=Desulfoluna sp. TaxID=2045199 RepID=UPI00262FEEFA|nr:hypothetical protein [Desulfoluna sp.]
MKNIATKMTQGLMMTSLLILLATPGYAGLTKLTPQELKGVTGQSGIQTLVMDHLTEDQKQDEEKNNREIQALIALNKHVPHELRRDIQALQITINDSTRIVREFGTIQQGILAVPMAVTTIISLPSVGLGGGGGFFF